MFGNFSNPVAAYKSVGVDVAIETADPHRLILMLFDGASIALRDARRHMEQGQIAEKGRAISQAIDIIANGLKASLNVEQGGNLAERLAALYDYMVTRLLYANLKNNTAALEEVSTLLAEIHSAWSEIGKTRQPGAESAAA